LRDTEAPCQLARLAGKAALGKKTEGVVENEALAILRRHAVAVTGGRCLGDGFARFHFRFLLRALPFHASSYPLVTQP
jgi:hypothetical protein